MNADEIRAVSEALPLPVVEWHYSYETEILTIRVDREVAYEGPETPGLRKLLRGMTNAQLVRAAINGAFSDDQRWIR